MNVYSTICRAFWSLMLIASVFTFNACKDSSSNNPDPAVKTAALTGQVVDEAGKPMEGVSVQSGSQTTTTDVQGQFALNAALGSDGRFLVKASKAGFYMSTMGVTPATTKARTQIMLTAMGAAKTFTAGAAASLDAGGGMLVKLPTQLTKNGAAYTGAAQAFLKYVSPNDPNLPGLMPGGDFAAQDATGARKTLITLGAVRVELQDGSGNALQLAGGQTAELRFPANGNTQATVPLWYLDEATGLWMEEGSATLQGSEYVGTVGHFSNWNLDIPTGGAGAKGKLRDCAGLPASGVRLRIGQKMVTTDQDGDFFASIPAGQDVTLSTEWGGTELSTTITAQAAGAIADLSSQLPCVPGIKGRLLTCGGQPISGFAMIRGTNGKILSYVQIGSNGNFNLTGPPSQTVTLTLSTDNGSNSKFADTTLAVPAPNGQTLDLGDIRACANAPGDTTNPIAGGGTMSFTLNGDGYTNQAITLGSGGGGTGLALANYYTSGESSVILANKITTATTYSATLTVPGKVPGTFTADNSGDANLLLVIFPTGNATNSVNYIIDDAHSGTITISQYGAVGEHIKGTFSGTLRKFSAQDPQSTTLVTVTNGVFDVVRGDDQ